MKSALKLCSFIAFYLQTQLLFISIVKCIEDSGSTKKENINPCQNQNFLIISTVDGVITALDMNTGKKCWSVVLDSEKFLSSSLSELEIFENGKRVWLVPSLDGGLYKYNNFRRVIQPLPVDVDSLLSHYLDSSTSVIGGKIKIVFGIDRLTGEIIYICKMNGCNKNLKGPFPQNMLIIEEITQYVNAVDSNKAEKKWHFRVSELKVKLTSQVPSDNPSVFKNDTHSNALIPRDYKEFVNVDAYKISLQNGFAGMINKTTQDFSWIFKASCPITDAWYVKDNIAKILDPFNKESGFFSVEMDDGMALLFLGTFENQMFIKKSKKFLVKDMNLNSLSTNVLYQTYLVPVCPKLENHISLLGSTSSTEDLTTDASWDFAATDFGSYFYMNFSIAENRTHCIINTSYIVRYEDSVKLSYQILVFYILASGITCLMFFIVVRILAGKILNKEYVNIGTSSIRIPVNEDAIVTDLEFRSRFDQDFEFISTLGRGGFGVVMDVKNKIDDCRYAVKRIRLHEQLNKLQYERVLREVKALAKLDHCGIVRYFNAWTEYPPLGWQEQKDKEYAIHDCSESSDLECSENISSLIESVSKPKRTLSDSGKKTSNPKKQKVSNSNIQKKLNQNPLALFDDNLLNEDYGSNRYKLQSNLNKNSFSSFNNQTLKSHCETEESSHSEAEESSHSEAEESSHSKAEESSQSEAEESSQSEAEESSSDEDSNLDACYNYSNFSSDIKQNSQDSFSVVFEASNEKMSFENDVLQKEIDSKHFHESNPSKTSFSRDNHFQVKIPIEHVKCYVMFRSLNDKLVSCKLNIKIFEEVCAYFFHDETILGISVTERSDWRKAINEDGIVNKLSFQQWLICILCLIKSSAEFTCPLLITNICFILSDINKSLNHSHHPRNGFTILYSKQPLTFGKCIVQSKTQSTLISSSKQDDVLSDIRESSSTSKSKAKERCVKDVPRGYLYIQMQLCRKESLRDWLDRNCDDREYFKVMEIFSQIVDAVHYVHNCGLMHRDLKPSNIYFSLEGAIKIGDFGLATSSEIHEASVNNAELSYTRTSDIGTEIYMSPEQKLKQDYDCKTDIYSLGIILFELLVPFRTLTERFKVLSKVRQCQFPEGFKEQYKNESELVRHLLHDDPANRPTAHEIKQHILLLKYTSVSKLIDE